MHEAAFNVLYELKDLNISGKASLAIITEGKVKKIPVDPLLSTFNLLYTLKDFNIGGKATILIDSKGKVSKNLIPSYSLKAAFEIVPAVEYIMSDIVSLPLVSPGEYANEYEEYIIIDLQHVSKLKESIITWDQITPFNTEINVEAGFSKTNIDQPVQWNPIVSGDPFPVDLGTSFDDGWFLWIRIYLSTNNTSVTPELSNMYVYALNDIGMGKDYGIPVPVSGAIDYSSEVASSILLGFHKIRVKITSDISLECNDTLIVDPNGNPNNIYNIRLIKLLPENIRKDPDIIAASKTVDKEFKLMLKGISNCLTFADIDNAKADVLDHLAAEMNTDFYNQELSLEKRRGLVKNAYIYHFFKGTPFAVEQLLTDVFDESTLEEWFDYGGDPFYFRVTTKDTIADGSKIDEIIRAINTVKNVRSVLEGINIHRENVNKLFVGNVIRQSNHYIIRV